MTATAFTSVTWGVLALGAVFPWAYWPLLWGALVTGLLGLHRGIGLPPTREHPVLLAVLAVSAAVAVQLVPLPASVLRTTSPATLSFLNNYIEVPNEVVAAATDGSATVKPATAAWPLSLRPRRTVTALCFVLALGLMIAGAAAGFGVSDARRLAAGLLVLGVIVAFMAIVQREYSGPIYWMWDRRHPSTSWGPFVNRNHFAGWMVMAISVGLGCFMALSSRAMRGVEGWRNRVLWLSSPEASGVLLTGLALVLMGFSLVLTASRSGMVAFIGSMLVVSVAAIKTRPPIEMPRQRRMVMLSYVACLAFVTVVWTGFPLIENRFLYSPTATPFGAQGRVVLWNDALDVVRRFPLTGTGLNTYTTVTPFFQEGDLLNTDEVHNDYLQLAAEGGLLVGIPVVALVALFIREVRRRFRAGTRSLTSYWVRVGAVAGLVAIAVQESVEFSLQLPGNAVMFAALCAIAVHKPEGT